mmetsp:Transcript_41658/g.103983  ORF Transcript_41658/g.103983 Transcript_41658/m.103983 type:complete len:110 (+) Transcript_41658:562-891(+)
MTLSCEWPARRLCVARTSSTPAAIIFQLTLGVFVIKIPMVWFIDKQTDFIIPFSHQPGRPCWDGGHIGFMWFLLNVIWSAWVMWEDRPKKKDHTKAKNTQSAETSEDVK